MRGPNKYIRSYLRALWGMALVFASFLGALPLSVGAAVQNGQPDTVRVAYYLEEGFQEGTADGKLKSGYSYDLLQKISGYTGWRYEYVYGEKQELYERFLAGEIDLFAGLSYNEKLAELVDFPEQPMDPEGTLFLCVRKNAPQLLERLNRALYRINQDSPDYLLMLREKYNDRQKEEVRFSPETSGWLNTHEVLRIGYVRNYLPFCDMDETGNVIGAISDIMRLWLETLELTDTLSITYVGYPTYMEMIQGMETGQIDAAFPITSSLWHSEESGLYETKSFLSVPMTAIYLESFQDDTLEKIAVTSRPIQTIYAKRYYPDSVLIGADSGTDCLDKVLTGKANCTIFTSFRAEYVLMEKKYSALQALPLAESMEYCIGVPKGETALLELLDYGISRLDQFTLTSIMYRYTQNHMPYTLMDFMRYNMELVFFIAALIFSLVTLIFLLIIYSQKKQKQAMKQAREEALLEAERAGEVLDAMYENLGIAAVIQEFGPDSAKKKLQCSDAFYRIFEYQGKDDPRAPQTAEEWWSIIHPKEREEVIQKIETIVRKQDGKSQYAVEYRAQTMTGGYRWFYAVGKVLRNEDGSPKALYGVVQDIDEKKAFEQSLQDQIDTAEALSRDYPYASIVDVQGDYTMSIKSEGKMVPKQKRRKNHDYQAVWKRFAEKYILKEDRERVLEAVEISRVEHALMENGEYSCIYKMELDGRVHTVQTVFLNAYSQLMKKTIVIAGFRIIDEIMKKEHEQQEILRAALLAAEQANRAKTAFLNNMSHDIRTPMNAILGYAELAERCVESTGQVMDYLEKITVSGNQLMNLINGVLDMSRIESGNMKLEIKQVNIRSLLADIRTIMQVSVDTKQLMMEVIYDDICHEYLMTDPVRLSQVLLNILSNAVKFTPAGGRISLGVRELMPEEKTGEATSTKLEFLIRDTGIGMSREYLEHIFEPFSREKTSTVSGIQGTGLGMAITKNIVDRMEGEIEVHSTRGLGTEFVVTLPFGICTEEDREELQRGEARPEKAQDRYVRTKVPSLAGKQVLVADDNELNREIITEILSQEDIRVWTVDDGDVAVKELSEAPAGRYDMILLDIQMPRLDGYAATKQIRALQDPEKAEIPIVAMTANAFEEDKKQAMEAGMDGFVTKPVNVKQLFELMRELLVKKE